MLVVTALNIIVVSLAYFARIEKYRYLLAWAFALLAIVLGIRYGYGNDYFSYKYMFDTGTPESGFSDSWEFGWLLLNKLFKPLGFSALVFFVTVVEHVMLYDIIRRHVPSQYYWFAVFIYVFNPYYMLIGLSMMRQFLVEVIGIYALEQAYKRNLLRFVIIVLIGASLHTMAYLLFFVYLFPYMLRISARTLFLALIIVTLIIAIKMDFVVDQLIQFFAESEMNYGDAYLNESVINEEYRLDPKLLIRYVIFFILMIRNISKLNVLASYFVIEVGISVIFLAFATISPMAVRASWIYDIVAIISIPLLVKEESVPLLKYGTIICFVLLLFKEYYNHFCSDIYGPYYSNYYTVFSEYAINGIRLY